MAALVDADAVDAEAACEALISVETEADCDASLASTDAMLSLATDHSDWAEYSLAD